MDENNFSFVVYMIHACADRWNVAPSKVYQVQVKTSALFQCLVYLRGCNIPTISTGMNHVNNKGKIILVHLHLL